jgi:hypothetical protein
MDSHERACGLADNRANRFQQTSFIFTPPINGIGQAGRHPIPDIPHNIENTLPWDDLSILTEYMGVVEREGLDALAQMLGRYRYTDDDEARPTPQPFSLAQITKWLAEGRFTKPY